MHGKPFSQYCILVVVIDGSVDLLPSLTGDPGDAVLKMQVRLTYRVHEWLVDIRSLRSARR